MLDETHYEYFIAMPTYDHFKRLVVVGLVDISGIDICHKNLAGSGPLTWKQRTSELDIPYLGIKAMPFCKVLRGECLFSYIFFIT